MSEVVLVGKRCPTCGETKPPSEFHRARSSRDGLHYECKVCNNTRAKRNAARRREEMGEEAWLAHQREVVARSRQRRDYARERQWRRAQWRAIRHLIDAHRKEYDALLARALYEVEHEDEDAA